MSLGFDLWLEQAIDIRQDQAKLGGLLLVFSFELFQFVRKFALES
jgi:hypothetical protein